MWYSSVDTLCLLVCRRLACDWEDVRPDILVLGKALSGGLLPVSGFGLIFRFEETMGKGIEINPLPESVVL